LISGQDFCAYGLPEGAIAVVDPLVKWKGGDVIATTSSGHLDFRRVPRNGRLRADQTVLGVVIATISVLRPS
jgi:hypothetical protein